MVGALYFNFYRRHFFAMSATAQKSTKRQFSSLNHQNFEFFGLVPRSTTQTSLICVKTLEPNISSLGPFGGGGGDLKGMFSLGIKKCGN
jgi:hypothetical protein